MTSWNRFLTAAIVAVAALAFSAAGVLAGCGEGDCPIEPPQSRQVVVSTHPGAPSVLEDPYAQPVQPAPLLMPLPVSLAPQVSSPQGESESRPSLDKIDVALRTQDPSDVSCGVQALGMALGALQGQTPTSSAILHYLDSQGYMYDFGTGTEELALAAQSLGYAGSVAFHSWTLEDLRDELAAGRPVVVDLGANGPDQPGHFVTLTGLTEDWSQVAYSDPILGERIVPLAEFMRLWDLQGNSGVSVAAAPPQASSPDYAPWAALFAGMMATLAVGPAALQDLRRRGVGGALVEDPGEVSTMSNIGKDPPYAEPAGMDWVRGDAVYETHYRTELTYHEVEKKELQKVAVGTTTEQVPYTKRIKVDNGHWETTYKSERYITGYHNKRILSHYKAERYIRYYKTRRVRGRYGWYTQKTPVYGYRSKPVYETLRIADYGYHQVPDSKVWVENWEWEEYTAYKAVVKTVYEDQWVVTGKERIPEEDTIKEQLLVGYHWTLVDESEGFGGQGLNSERPPETDKERSPLEFETDIIQEMRNIRASMPRTVVRMRTTAPLRVRSHAGVQFDALTITSEGAEVMYTGTKKEHEGAVWYQVRYRDPLKGTITGWVHSGYLEHPPPTLTFPENPELESNDASLMREFIWYKYLTPEEQAAYIENEKRLLELLWTEIYRLTRAGIAMGGGVEGLILRDIVEEFLKPPDWYVNDNLPDPFVLHHLRKERELSLLRMIVLNPNLLTAKLTDRTWEIFATVLDLNEADLKTHVLGNAFWDPESGTSVGSFPVEMFVSRKHGHYLLKHPSPRSENVSDAFLGVPYGEKVTWNGTYELGTDEDGNRVIYYQVSWKFNGQTYQGWITNQFLSPVIQRWGDVDVTGREGTYGYGGGTDAWSKYYSGSGAAQNLNLSLLMKDLGFEDYDEFAESHKNLCGWLATMEATGLSLEEGFRIVAELYPEMLKNSDNQAGVGQLVELVHSLASDGWSATTDNNPSTLLESYSLGKILVALVAVDENGKFASDKEVVYTGHWIRIHEMTNGGVRYYDSLTNTIITASSEAFMMAGENAQYVSENSANSANLFIEISR